MNKPSKPNNNIKENDMNKPSKPNNNIKGMISTSMKDMDAQVRERQALYDRKEHKTIIQFFGVFAALSNAAKMSTDEFLGWLSEQSGQEVNDCQAFISALKALDFYPANWPSPQAIYNGAMARKNQGRNSAWRFDESAENGGFVENLDSGKKMFLVEFLNILRICKMFDKRKETSEKNRRITELHGAVMRRIINIQRATKRGNIEEIAAERKALEKAYEDAVKAKVEFSSTEIASYDDAMGKNTKRIPASEKIEADITAKIAAAQKEAAEKAAAEYEEKLQQEREKRLKAEKAAEEVEKAKKETEKWKEDREKLRKENAETQILLRKTAEKFNQIQAIAYGFDHKPSMEELEKFLEDIRELTK